MSVGSTTSNIAMINLVMTAADGSGAGWQDPVQLIPLGMNDDPVAFVQNIKAGLPLVNNLRVMFNPTSFNPDGSLHPQMEAFLNEAVAQGYDLTIVLGDGDAQNIGIGSATWPALSNAEAYDALSQNYADLAGAWTKMMDWMDAHTDVKSAVYGWELMNESAGYRHAIRDNGPGDGLTKTDFVQLYADHALALSDLIQSRADGKVLVGGWGYNGDLLGLTEVLGNGQTALDYLRAGVGADLVWSAHLYPGWIGTSAATTPEELVAILDEVYSVVAGDDVLITEINANGKVDDPASGVTYEDLFVASYEWFAANGIGLGWYPGVQTGASGLMSMDSMGTLAYRHQHSLAHAMNAFSISQSPAGTTASQVINAELKAITLINENYEIALGETKVDAAPNAGFGFGYGGHDTLRGTDFSNDFLYGGTGNDLMQGYGADDFLFGQSGHDALQGSAGVDNLFGGLGHDTLDGGAGRDFMAGGAQNDRYIVDSTTDTVQELVNEGLDTVLTDLAAYTLSANVEALIYSGSGNFTGTGNTAGNTLTGGTLADTLLGGAGNDILVGGRGADSLDGGSGSDAASYEAASAAVIADLLTVTTGTSAGEAAGDSFLSIEVLRGSAFSDQLSGTNLANTLIGNGGNDILQGRGGADRLYGGTGEDMASYHRATAGVVVNLMGVTSGTSAGEAAGDTFSLIENLRGSNYADKLYGDAGANKISGLSGVDTLAGRAGTDTLYGGAGADYFVFAKNYDADRVADFTNNVDTLRFSGFAGVTTAAQALSHARQIGADVLFDFGAGDTLRVTGTTLGALADDILIL